MYVFNKAGIRFYAGATGLSPVVDKLQGGLVREADLIVTVGFDPVELRSDWLAPWDERKRTSMQLQPIVQGQLGSIAGVRRVAFLRPPLPGGGRGLPVIV